MRWPFAPIVSRQNPNQGTLQYADRPDYPMLSTGPQIQVLCFGNDPRLLATRHMVLATRYDAVSVGTFAQLETLPQSSNFRVVVLCHTLKADECERTAAIVRQHWPEAKILAIALRSESCSEQTSDARMASLEGPSALLQAVDNLLIRVDRTGYAAPQSPGAVL